MKSELIASENERILFRKALILWHSGGSLSLVFLAATLLIISCIPAMASADLPAKKPLPAGLGEIIASPAYNHSFWGLLVKDLDSNETLLAINPDKMFVPASTTKLFTVAAALDTLGADYRFETPVYSRGEVDSRGRLKGDLILVASGVPDHGRQDYCGWKDRLQKRRPHLCQLCGKDRSHVR